MNLQESTNLIASIENALDENAIIMRIVSAVARKHGIKAHEIMGESRMRYVAWPRQEAYARVMEYLGGLSATARFFNRNHKTIWHGIRAYEHRKARMKEANG